MKNYMALLMGFIYLLQITAVICGYTAEIYDLRQDKTYFINNEIMCMCRY